jgi:hypothetical protein
LFWESLIVDNGPAIFHVVSSWDDKGENPAPLFSTPFERKTGRIRISFIIRPVRTSPFASLPSHPPPSSHSYAASQSTLIYTSPDNNSAHSLALNSISPIHPSTYTIRPTVLRNRTRVSDTRAARSAVATREHVGDRRGRGCDGGESQGGDEGDEGSELHRGIEDVGV